MAKHTTPKEISLGVCTFCQEKFAKNKFTQHLKTCKGRFNLADKQEGQSQRLFHLQVEGKYRPEYWMHLELPATATLADLDGFLRFAWLECCDHLSEFEIDGESYEYNPNAIWENALEALGTPEDEDKEDEEDEEDEEDGPELGMQEIASEMSRQLALEFQTDLKNVPVSEIEKRLEALFAENMPPGMSSDMLPMLRPLLTSMAESLQQGTLAQDLAAMENEDEEDEEDGIYSELSEVLEVGGKFSYVYDFGSSSTLSLRVISEREGVVPVLENEKDEENKDDREEISILVMARNEAPALVCHICGKPATSVPSGSEYEPLAAVALCEAHAAKTDYPDELLPIVNSPRTGICGYTGDEFEDEWEFEEDEDEDEEK